MARDSWEAVIDLARSDLKDSYEGPDSDYHDIILEIADGQTPIYNADRLEVILSNMWLGSTESELGSDNTVFGLAGVVICDAIQSDLHEYLFDLNNAWKEEHGICEACDKEFLIEDSNADDSENFCSVECEEEFNTEEVEVA